MKTIKVKGLKKLSDNELLEISGGSEHSESLFYYLGCAVKFLEAFSSGASKGSANRFA